MTKRSFVSCAVLMVVALLAACGGDGSTEPGGLSAEQVQTMASALSSLLATSLFVQEARRAPSVRLDVRGASELSLPISGMHACPEGGRLGVTGTFTADDNGSLIYALSDTLVDCGIKGKDSNVWVFTTKPTLEVSIAERFEGDSTGVQLVNVEQNDVGRVQYSSGALSGSCDVNLVLENHYAYRTPTPDSATISLHSEGTICGRPVLRDTASTIGVPTLP